MGKIIDLTGQKFNKLTVLEAIPERKNRQVVWKCQCDCGNITYVVGQALRTGHTKSCGCLNFEKKDTDSLIDKVFGELTVLERDLELTDFNRVYWICECSCGRVESILGIYLRNGDIVECSVCRKNKQLVNPWNDLSEEKFGLLTPIAPTLKRQNGKVVWKCQCDCGNICEVSSNSLVSRNTLSCGCLKNKSIGEETIKNFLMNHQINFQRQVSFKDCLSPKNAKLLFDFGIYENEKLIKLIEYDGIQHFTPVEFFGGEVAFNYLQECDTIKNDFCKKNNIPLLRIQYTQQDEIIHLLEDFLC